MKHWGPLLRIMTSSEGDQLLLGAFHAILDKIQAGILQIYFLVVNFDYIQQKKKQTINSNVVFLTGLNNILKPLCYVEVFPYRFLNKNSISSCRI